MSGANVGIRLLIDGSFGMLVKAAKIKKDLSYKDFIVEILRKNGQAALFFSVPLSINIIMGADISCYKILIINFNENNSIAMFYIDNKNSI